MPSSENPEITPELDSPEFARRIFDSFWTTAFLPEIERRQNIGLIGKDFSPRLMQWLITADGESRVLFNDEVQVLVQVRLGRPLEIGETLKLEDPNIIGQLELPDEHQDCGHVTFLRIGDIWKGTFNFTYGRATARDTFRRASQFLFAARTSFENDHVGPAIENLFSAAELASRAELTLNLSKATKAKTHGTTASEINILARRGSIDPEFVRLFNSLGRQRGSARYGDKDHPPTMPTQQDIDLVAKVIEDGLLQISSKIEQ